MKNDLINNIKAKMVPFLNEVQLEELDKNLKIILNDFEVFKKDKHDETKENHELLLSFLSAKEIEGCSQKTITYYKNTIMGMLNSINSRIEDITTDDLRKYLSDYKN